MGCGLGNQTPFRAQPRFTRMMSCKKEVEHLFDERFQEVCEMNSSSCTGKRKLESHADELQAEIDQPFNTTNEDVSQVARSTRIHIDIPQHQDPANPKHFDHFLFHLLSYRAQKQSFSVTKDESPKLFEFTQFLKNEYRKRLQDSTHDVLLSTQQFTVLESLHVPLTTRGDDHWNRFYVLLEQYKKAHGHVLVPRLCEIPGLGDWVTDQRRQYKAMVQGSTLTSTMSPERVARLESLGFVWQVRSRPEWEDRYKELVEYKKEFGDCKVPQHFSANKALGKWVAKQREQYKLLKKGQHSFLNDYRIETLEKIGFVWSIRSGAESSWGHSAGKEAVKVDPTDGETAHASVEPRTA